MIKRFLPFIFSLLMGLLPYTAFSTGTPGRQEAKIDQVYAQFGLSGKGAIVAMIDRGIDYSHPDFIDENGQTRIAYIFDMIDNTGANASNNPYGVGTIFTAAQINSALQSNTVLSTDRFGHGTATTSIACGNGSAVAGTEFRGVAYEATIIVVKITHDGFPAFGNQPGQAGSFNPGNIPIALQFVADKITELGLPGVALMNIGSVGGPTDGTSTICRAMDDFVAKGHTLVCGVGDDGGAANYAGGTITQGNSTEILINKGEVGNLRFDMWYSEDNRYDVTIERPNGQKLGPFAAPNGTNGVDDRSFTDIFYYHRGAAVEFYGATSNRREVLIDIQGATGTYKITLTAATVGTTGDFSATLNPSLYGNTNRFMNNTMAGYNVNDYTTANQVISPADYVIKNDWFDLNNIFRDITGQGESGEIWIGSSAGPSHDGRMVTDFAAPGEVLYGAYSPNTWYGNFVSNQIQGSNGHYGIQNAVSAAAPLSTGVIALMLELKPTLTPQEIKMILQQTARQDNFTGPVPNNTWGGGKLDALAAIQAVSNLVPVADPDLEVASLNVFPNPTAGDLFFSLPSSQVPPKNMIITNHMGQIVRQLNAKEIQDQSINTQFLPQGIYYLSAEGVDWRLSEKFVKF